MPLHQPCGWSPAPAAQGRIGAAGTTALTQVFRREIIAGFAVTGDGETRDEDYDQECGQALVHVSHPKHSRPWREEMTTPKILSTRGADKALENRRLLEDGIPVGYRACNSSRPAICHYLDSPK